MLLAAPTPPAPLNAFGFHLTGVGLIDRTGVKSLIVFTGVGSKRFVEYVKSALSALAKGREPKEAGDSCQLREPSAPYGDHFGLKNEDIGADNAYFLNKYSE